MSFQTQGRHEIAQGWHVNREENGALQHSEFQWGGRGRQGRLKSKCQWGQRKSRRVIAVKPRKEIVLKRRSWLCGELKDCVNRQLNTGFAVDLLLSKAVLYVLSPHLDKHNACPSFCSHLLTLEGMASLCAAHCSAFYPCSRSPPFLPFLGTPGHPFSAMDLQPPSHWNIPRPLTS